ncbi:MAG: hypothetical protein NTW25_11300 [Candidatus Kapabacteria bacterium]|nr:hypothetical protein [Candidatus Kapabacteria bacterium]
MKLLFSILILLLLFSNNNNIYSQKFINEKNSKVELDSIALKKIYDIINKKTTLELEFLNFRVFDSIDRKIYKNLTLSKHQKKQLTNCQQILDSFLNKDSIKIYYSYFLKSDSTIRSLYLKINYFSESKDQNLYLRFHYSQPEYMLYFFDKIRIPGIEGDELYK